MPSLDLPMEMLLFGESDAAAPEWHRIDTTEPMISHTKEPPTAASTELDGL
jgi:hypothetical protein